MIVPDGVLLPEFRVGPDPAAGSDALQLIPAADQEEKEGRRKTGNAEHPERRNVERRIQRRRNDADDVRRRRRVVGQRHRRLERGHRDRQHFSRAEGLVLRTGNCRRCSGFAETGSGQEVERDRMPETLPVPLRPLF